MPHRETHYEYISNPIQQPLCITAQMLAIKHRKKEIYSIKCLHECILGLHSPLLDSNGALNVLFQSGLLQICPFGLV